MFTRALLQEYLKAIYFAYDEDWTAAFKLGCFLGQKGYNTEMVHKLFIYLTKVKSAFALLFTKKQDPGNSPRIGLGQSPQVPATA